MTVYFPTCLGTSEESSRLVERPSEDQDKKSDKVRWDFFI